MLKFYILIVLALISTQAQASEDEAEVEKRSAIPDYYSQNAAAYPNYPAQQAAAAAPAAATPSAAQYPQARSDVAQAAPAQAQVAQPAAPAAPSSPAATPAAASSNPTTAASASTPAAESSSYASSQSSYPYPSSKPREESAYARSSYPSSYYPAPAPAPAPASYYPAGYPASYSSPRRQTQPAAPATNEKPDVRYILPQSQPLTPPRRESITKCDDDRRAENFCMQANNPCFCEENRHFMFNYCKRSCGFCSDAGTPHKFWRVSNGEPMERSWIVREVKFFTDKLSNAPLNINPVHAFSSSNYAGYPASLAMDGNDNTGWQPDGWWERPADSEFVGYEFDAPVVVNSIYLESDPGKPTTPRRMFVEAADYQNGPWQRLWMIENDQRQKEIRFNNPQCPLFWKRFASNEGTFCYKLFTAHSTFRDARDMCARHGGDLASVNSIEEGRWILSSVKPCGFTWIGLNDIQREGDFEWSDGSNKTFAYWAADEIKDDIANRAEDCVATTRSAEWRQFHCANRFHFLCKKPLVEKSEEDAKAHLAGQEGNKTNLPILPMAGKGMQFPFPLPFPFPIPGEKNEKQNDVAAPEPAPKAEEKDSGSASDEDEDEEEEEDDDEEEDEEEEASGTKKSEQVEKSPKEGSVKGEEGEEKEKEKPDKSTNESSGQKTKRNYIFYSD